MKFSSYSCRHLLCSQQMSSCHTGRMSEKMCRRQKMSWNKVKSAETFNEPSLLPSQSVYFTEKSEVENFFALKPADSITDSVNFCVMTSYWFFIRFNNFLQHNMEESYHKHLKSVFVSKKGQIWAWLNVNINISINIFFSSKLCKVWHFIMFEEVHSLFYF